MEVGFDVSYDTAKTETRTLDYYATNNTNAARVKKYNNINSWWWLRSAYSDDYNDFSNVNLSGSTNYSNASYTNGVAPAFRIG